MKSSFPVGVLFPSWPAGHQPERGKRQEGRQKALYVAHEHERRRPSKRQMSVNQLSFISEYEE